MATRKLVDISDDNYKELQKLRAECERRKLPLVPTMPTLVNMAIKGQIAALYQNFLPSGDVKKFNG